mmetsp:Transcript_50585/g.69295  ORF Transcript_50585/g.69295 Transcript_50585/m.69295 type:complete len:377 (+) Transcript_50585:711-1841(+)
MVVLLVRRLDDRQRDTHVLGKRLSGWVELHDTTAGVVLAMPDDLIRRSLVQAQAEGWLVLPHLTGDVVAAAELVGEALAVRIKHQATDTAQRLGRKELDLGIRIIGLHQAGGVHLNPFKVDALATDGLTHLNAVAGAVLAVSGRQVHQVRAVLGQQRVRGEVRAEAACRQDDGAELLEGHGALLVRAADAITGGVGQQLGHTGLGDDARLVGALRDLLNHLDQGVGDGHAREALSAAVRPGHGVATEARDEGQVEVELLHKPVHIGAAVVAQDLHQLGLLGAALQGVVGEDVVGVSNALGLLRLRCGTVDAASRLRRVAATEGGLIQQDDLGTVLQHRVRGRHAAKAAADHNGQVSREIGRHGNLARLARGVALRQ